LRNLRVLNASGNLMTGVPAEIGQLTKLQELNLSNNQLTGLPSELGNLTSLRVLDLRGNAVSKQDLDGIRAKLTGTQIQE
jgi:Leucine-rich repeat (LRR) protein